MFVKTKHESLWCPCRIPQKFFIGTRKYVPNDMPETPLIAFINAKSGGNVGPRLAEILYRSLGKTQVVRLFYMYTVYSCRNKVYVPLYRVYCISFVFLSLLIVFELVTV